MQWDSVWNCNRKALVYISYGCLSLLCLVSFEFQSVFLWWQTNFMRRVKSIKIKWILFCHYTSCSRISSRCNVFICSIRNTWWIDVLPLAHDKVDMNFYHSTNIDFIYFGLYFRVKNFAKIRFPKFGNPTHWAIIYFILNH